MDRKERRQEKKKGRKEKLRKQLKLLYSIQGLREKELSLFEKKEELEKILNEDGIILKNKIDIRPIESEVIRLKNLLEEIENIVVEKGKNYNLEQGKDIFRSVPLF